METHPATRGIVGLFAHYKDLAEKALAQVEDAELHRVLAADGNSVATIMRHIAGNLRSRFTDLLTTDGEKPWRDREDEFREGTTDRTGLLEEWGGAWAVFFREVGALTEADLARTILIRNEPHLVLDALHRQLAHYAYHVGQMVLLARTFRGTAWRSLSIPRGGSARYNAERGL